MLAGLGLASRREIENWIRDGRITVDNQPATLGQRVRPHDHIRVDGKPIHLPKHADRVRVLLYKKRVGELVTRDDPEGRRTVFRKLPALEHGRWIAIGRLDINTSGLLLLTNSGELARRLMHPSFQVEREYAVRVLGNVTEETLQRLREGVQLEDGLGRFESIYPSDSRHADEDDDEGVANRWYNVVVREGRNRMVRRLWESQRFQVSRLIRVRYGPIALGRGTRSGGSRELDEAETAALLDAVGMSAG